MCFPIFCGQIDPGFDSKAFCDTVYNVRKAYRYRAIALIEICQLFLIDSDQLESLEQYAELLR
jgi:hypothetical protein